MSGIWLYEARANKLGLCQNCTETAPFTKFAPGIWTAITLAGGPVYDFGPPQFPNNIGTIRLLLRNEYVRQNFFGLTGTYYDKQLTDAVYRYDILYAPKVPSGSTGTGFGAASTGALFGAEPKWGETTRWVIATDRPTYIPWISKQHTFLVAQYSVTWNPDPPPGSRALNSFAFLAANNWMLDGRLTTLNVFAWDPDSTVGFLSSGNAYRYSRNVVLNLNAVWFLGKSGLYGGLGGILSRAQRTNSLEFRYVYEL